VLITLILPFQVSWCRSSWCSKDRVDRHLPAVTATCFFGNPFYIFCAAIFLSLTEELNDAARIDGSGEFRFFFQMAIPLSTPVLATVAIFSFLRSWNDFVGPLIFLANDKLYTLAIGAQLIRSRLQPNWEILMPLGVVMVLPVLAVFFPMQKYFIQGIAMSGIKGRGKPMIAVRLFLRRTDRSVANSGSRWSSSRRGSSGFWPSTGTDVPLVVLFVPESQWFRSGVRRPWKLPETFKDKIFLKRSAIRPTSSA
jgi:hypothetical protein